MSEIETVSDERLAEMLGAWQADSERARRGHGMNMHEEEIVSVLTELLSRRSLDTADGVEAVATVPARMSIDGNTVKAIMFMLGSAEQEGEFGDGVLWVGKCGDGAEATYGLHLSNSEYPEEGSETLVEFPPSLASPPSPAEVTDEMVERAARAMEPMAFQEEFTATDEGYELEQEGRNQALGRARAALTAALDQQPVMTTISEGAEVAGQLHEQANHVRLGIACRTDVTVAAGYLADYAIEAAALISSLVAERDQQRDLAERLKLEAQGHAQEARHGHPAQ